MALSFRETNSADSAASSPSGQAEIDSGETEEEAKAKRDRLREEQRQKRKAVSDLDSGLKISFLTSLSL